MVLQMQQTQTFAHLIQILHKSYSVDMMTVLIVMVPGFLFVGGFVYYYSFFFDAVIISL